MVVVADHRRRARGKRVNTSGETIGAPESRKDGVQCSGVMHITYTPVTVARDHVLRLHHAALKHNQELCVSMTPCLDVDVNYRSV